MDLELRNQVIIVTGGGSGVGRETAKLLCGEGATVIVADIFLEKAQETAEMIAKLPGKSISIKADVTKPEEVQEMVAQVHAQFDKVDVLVNNAGLGVLKAFKDTDMSDWMTDLGVNLFGTLNCTRAVIESMITRKYGRIINIVSDAGRVGEPFTATYSAAKAGVIGFSKALAKEVGRYGVIINCVSLGATKTPLIMPVLTADIEAKLIKSYPLGRLGLPNDPAMMIVFLSSPKSTWITGQVFSVNGGYSMI